MAKILIADDNKQITSILAEYAKKNGYEPIIAFNGEEAFNKFETENPDILHTIDFLFYIKLILKH